MEKIEMPRQWLGRERKFLQTLHGKGPLGRIFRQLCEAGCEEQTLQTDLFTLTRLPRKKLEKQYKAKDFQKLKIIAASLEKAAKNLGSFDELLFLESFAGLNFQREYADWERPVEIPRTLLRLSGRLRECVASAKSSHHGIPTTYDRIPAIVGYVREKTGRAHYPELVTLMKFALPDQAFTEEQLRMIPYRRSLKTKKR
jgi:hypothetical protein